MSGPLSLGFAFDCTDGSEEWYTPPVVFEALGLTFDLDPCAPVGGLPWIPARRFLSLADDGLTSPWDGSVWLNPPYGDETPRWLDRLALHGNGVALVFSRTDTAWFHRIVPTADAVCFVRGRLAFLRGATVAAGAGAGAGSLLLGWGASCADAVMGCQLGWALRPPLERRGPR